MGDAATPTLPDFTSQTASAYKANIDAGFAVADRIAWAFAAHEQATPDMSVRLEAGAVFDGATLTEVAAQSTATITAPTTDPRIDRLVVNRATGAVSVVTGTEAASPTPPAITGNVAPVAQVALVVSQSSIVNADITDERNMGLLGLGFLAADDIDGLTEDASPDVNADFIATHDASAGVAKKVKLANLGATDDVARNNILLNAFRIAINGGLSVLNMADGIVDEFEDETGVDTGGSTNETYDATGDLYTNKEITAYTNSGGQGNRTGSITVTTTVTLAGGTINNLVDGGFADNNSDSAPFNVQTVAGLYIKFDFGVGASKVIDEAKFYQSGSTSHGTWKWQGSDNDSSWTDIGGTFSLQGDTSGLPALTTLNGNITGYRYYRLLGVSGSTNLSPWNREIEFQIGEATKDMTLISNSVTAETADPTEARIVLFEEDVVSITENTDLKAYASRDGGTTWTQITLADEGDFGTGKRILAGTADISGQPTGTSMKYKIDTLNTKLLRLHGAALQWS